MSGASPAPGRPGNGPRPLRAALGIATLGIAALAASPSRTPPAPEAQLFGEGVLSTPDDEVGIALAPDGRTAYFGKRSRTTTTPPVSAICVSRLDRGGRWSEPEVAPFSGRFHDLFPALSPDGRRLYLTSDRPLPGRPARPDPDGLNLHLWKVERTGSGWMEPRRLGPPIEDAGSHEQAASEAADGTLYFASDRPAGDGRYHLFRARRLGARSYAAPESLGALDGPGWDSQPAIAPDQSVLVFASRGRPDALVGGGARYNRSDLYASFRTRDGWSAPRHLAPPINSVANEWCPSFTADGRWLFFTSERGFAAVPMRPRLTAATFAAGLAGTLNGAGNLYRIDAAAVRDLAEPAREAGHARR